MNTPRFPQLQTTIALFLAGLCLLFVGGITALLLFPAKPSKLAETDSAPIPAAPLVASQPVGKTDLLVDRKSKNTLTLPSLQKVVWDYETKIGSSSRSDKAGIKLFVTIQNKSQEAITHAEFVIQTRERSRTVAQQQTVAGGRIAGGVEPNATETIPLFIPKSELGLSDFQDLPENWEIECAIMSHATTATDSFTHPKPLSVIIATVKDPARRFLNSSKARNPFEASIQSQLGKP